MRGFVLIIVTLFRFSKTEDYDFETYFKNEIVLDDVNETKALMGEEKVARSLEKAITSSYYTPRYWDVDAEIPYYVVLVSSKYERPDNPDYQKMCGGALLTKDTVITFCSCVSNYLWGALEGHTTYTDVPWARKEDLGKVFRIRIDIRGHTSRYPADPLGKSTNYYIPATKQLPNEDCMWIYNKASFARPLEWEQRTTFALIKFSPNYSTPSYEGFAPWPPAEFRYTKLLEVGEHATHHRHLWGLSSSDSGQTAAIYSINMKVDKAEYFKEGVFDQYGKKYNMLHRPLTLYTSLCDQTMCLKEHPYINMNIPPIRKKKYGCFCDGYNYDSLCGGVHGSPVVWKGLLLGLLFLGVPCSKTGSVNPRVNIVIGFDVNMTSLIYRTVASLRERIENQGSNRYFRSKTMLHNYDVFFPDPELMPKELDFEIAVERLGPSFSNHLHPQLYFYMISLPLCFFARFV